MNGAAALHPHFIWDFNLSASMTGLVWLGLRKRMKKNGNQVAFVGLSSVGCWNLSTRQHTKWTRANVTWLGIVPEQWIWSYHGRFMRFGHFLEEKKKRKMYFSSNFQIQFSAKRWEIEPKNSATYNSSKFFERRNYVAPPLVVRSRTWPSSKRALAVTVI